MSAAWRSACSRVTVPSRRPRVAAKPLLVVASARYPRVASIRAEPMSHGLGMSSGRPGWCRSRNAATSSARAGISVIRSSPVGWTTWTTLRLLRAGHPGVGAEREGMGHFLALANERCLGTDHAELVSFRVGEYGPRLGAGLPDVDPARTERENALDLGVPLAGASGEVEVYAILDDLPVGHRHEADPERCGRLGADDDFPLPLRQDLPTQHPGPEPRQRRQIVGIDDNVMQQNSHAGQYRPRAVDQGQAVADGGGSRAPGRPPIDLAARRAQAGGRHPHVGEPRCERSGSPGPAVRRSLRYGRLRTRSPARARCASGYAPRA